MESCCNVILLYLVEVQNQSATKRSETKRPASETSEKVRGTRQVMRCSLRAVEYALCSVAG